MKGCSGCLVGLVSLGIVALAAGGLIGAGMRMLAKPVAASLPATTAADGTRAQQKLFDVARANRLNQPVSITEAEVNALLSRHLVEARGVRLNTLGVRLVGDDRVELTGQAPLRQLLDEAGLGGAASVLPERSLRHPMWIHIGARTHVTGEPRRQLSLDVEDFAVGRQRLPVGALRLLLDPAAVGLLRWPLPEHVHEVTIEPGRVVIRGASSRSRSEAAGRTAAHRGPASPRRSDDPRSSPGAAPGRR